MDCAFVFFILLCIGLSIVSAVGKSKMYTEESEKSNKILNELEKMNEKMNSIEKYIENKNK